MWLPCTRIRDLLRAAACAFLLVAGAPGNAVAGLDVEKVVMPGKLIQQHAKYEADCGSCHVRFDRAAQFRLCLACHDHKDVARDIQAGTGYHGRIQQLQCRTCHTDHKGRTARITVLDPRKFDHGMTDFALREKHAAASCERCHKPNVKRRNTPTQCAGCHRESDRHKGELDPRCETCHNQTTWKEPRVDHDRTRFPLRNRHAEAPCAACHPTQQGYRETPRDCASCHRQQQDRHKGQFGDRCDTCHSPATTWKVSSFQHDRDSKFLLQGKHREIKCESCHKGTGPREKPEARCSACHARDDAEKGHDGRRGPKCETCHSAKAWKPASFDHDVGTRFVLRDKHRSTKCESCHKRRMDEERLEGRCINCHARDERHEGQLGTDCAGCHRERGWRETTFDHSNSRFPLLGRHARAECKACHETQRFKEVPSACEWCHAKHDVHVGRYTPQCGDCHDPLGWKRINYDHTSRGRFVVDGKHANLPCSACHKPLLQAMQEVPPRCVNCHRSEDVHFNTYGSLCERCHVPADWRRIVGPAGPTRGTPLPAGKGAR